MSPKHGTTRQRLIVNADDLGRTEGINEGVFAAHLDGIVTSATVMVAYPAAATALSRWGDFPRLGLGLHVALSGGPTVLPAARVPSLVDGAGRLPARPELHQRAIAAEVQAEVEAQYARFCELAGRPPTHLDGHHHCHRLPLVADAVIAIARREGLPVRTVGESLGARLAEAKVSSTDAFDDSFYGDAVGLHDLLERIAALGPGTSELMCHPARIDPELRAGSSYVEPRLTELESLTHPQVLQAVEDAGIQLIHFGELAG